MLLGFGLCLVGSRAFAAAFTHLRAPNSESPVLSHAFSFMRFDEWALEAGDLHGPHCLP